MIGVWSHFTGRKHLPTEQFQMLNLFAGPAGNQACSLLCQGLVARNLLQGSVQRAIFMSFQQTVASLSGKSDDFLSSCEDSRLFQSLQVGRQCFREIRELRLPTAWLPVVT